MAAGNTSRCTLRATGPTPKGFFLEEMDHSVCAVDPASLYAIPHENLIRTFRARPNVGFAVWRETIDAATFREAVTNNSSRAGMTRLAHFFSEIHFRSNANGLVEKSSCPLPLSETQLGETSGMSIATVNRHLQKLRRSRAADLSGRVVVANFPKLNSIADFDPEYFHLQVQPKV